MPIIPLLPGDLADRQTILELKINHCNITEFDEDRKSAFELGSQGRTTITRTVVNKEEKKDVAKVAAFMTELDRVRKELETKWVPDLQRMNRVEVYDKLYDVLEEANRQLWDLEDMIRALEAAPEVNQMAWLIRVKDTAFGIRQNNDLRAQTIKQINALWNYQTQEKMY